jgi:chemotaxis protein methyltransferase CheR
MNDELARLRDLIHERTGLDLRRGLDGGIFEERIAGPFEKSGCGSFSDYYTRLRDSNIDSSEWTHVVAAFARPASSFYRHERHTKILSETLIPRLLSDRDRLRIWSAGCSTGEESLMIAMTLDDAGWFDRVDIEINASDANAISIEHARRGLYTDQRIGTLREPLREKYFIRTTEGWQADRSLLSQIAYTIASLATESDIADLASSDVVFCRNVFLYFSDAAIERTLRVFEKHMLPGGYLITDEGEHYERLISGLGIFEEERVGGILVRRKI